MASAGSTDITVSIILPVRNEEPFISRVLTDLKAQDFPKEKMEVLVVDGMSEDKTVEVAERFREEFPNFGILENPGKLASRARNIGLRVASGQYLLFIDGHCSIPSHGMIADMVELFEEREVDVLCRPQPLTMKPQTTFQMAVAAARASIIGHGLDSTIYSDRERFVNAASSGAMYRREVIEKIGYFDEDFDACEDVEFNFRADQAGLKALISPKLTVEYAARKSFGALFRQLYRYGIGRWRLFRKHPATMGLGTIITILFVIGVFLYPLIWLSSTEIGLLATVPVLIYLAVVVGVSFRIVKNQPRSMLVMLPFVFFTIHFSLGIGFLAGGFKVRS